MKPFVFLFVALFSASSLFSQEVFKLGTVKGKHVTYEVKEQNSFPWGRIVKNTRKSDTAKVEVMDVFNLVAQTWDIEMQIAKIIHDRLLPGELRKLSKIAKSFPSDHFQTMIRIDSNKLVQVEWFVFYGMYREGIRKCASEIPDTTRRPMNCIDRDSSGNITKVQYFVKEPEYRKKEPDVPSDGFWIHFDPDRLYEIEKDIVKKVMLPPGMTRDFVYVLQIGILYEYICNLKKAREVREEAIEAWKEEMLRSRSGSVSNI